MRYPNISFMIAIMIIALFSSCDSSLDKTEKKEIESEVIKEINRFFDYDQKTFVEKVSKMYWKNDDFILINDLELYDYESLMEATKEGVKPVVEYELKKKDSKFQIIDAKNVLAILEGRLSVKLTDSSRVSYDTYICSILFRKINEEWKIAYFQQATEMYQERKDSIQY